MSLDSRQKQGSAVACSICWEASYWGWENMFQDPSFQIKGVNHQRLHQLLTHILCLSWNAWNKWTEGRLQHLKNVKWRPSSGSTLLYRLILAHLAFHATETYSDLAPAATVNGQPMRGINPDLPASPFDIPTATPISAALPPSSLGALGSFSFQPSGAPRSGIIFPATSWHDSPPIDLRSSFL